MARKCKKKNGTPLFEFSEGDGRQNVCKWYESNEALVSGEFNSTFNGRAETPWSAYRNESKSNTTFATTNNNRKLVKKELVDIDILLEVRIEIYSFFCSQTAYAHHFVSKVCYARWSAETFTTRDSTRTRWPGCWENVYARMEKPSVEKLVLLARIVWEELKVLKLKHELYTFGR